MKYLFPKLAFFLLSSCAPTVAHQVLKEPSLNQHVEAAENLGLSVELMAKFHSWAEYHDKTYESHEDKMERLKIWVQNDGTFVYLIIVRIFFNDMVVSIRSCVAGCALKP